MRQNNLDPLQATRGFDPKLFKAVLKTDTSKKIWLITRNYIRNLRLAVIDRKEARPVFVWKFSKIHLSIL